MDMSESRFDKEFSQQPAQYANHAGKPTTKWVNVKKTLGDLDTTRSHFVKLPIQYIVIDFDLKNDEGEKDLAKNLEAASMWPATY